MNDVQHFLATQIYQQQDGAITPIIVFAREFSAWLDCPARQLYWCQHQRIQRALADLGFPVGYAAATDREFGGVFIANLTGPGSRHVCWRPLSDLAAQKGLEVMSTDAQIVARDVNLLSVTLTKFGQSAAHVLANNLRFFGFGDEDLDLEKSVSRQKALREQLLNDSTRLTVRRGPSAACRIER